MHLGFFQEYVRLHLHYDFALLVKKIKKFLIKTKITKSSHDDF